MPPRKTEAVKAVGAGTTITVERSLTRDNAVVNSESESDTISIHQFATEPASTGVSLGITINIGNFESVRIDVTCKVPCYTEELPQAFEFAQNFAEARLQEQISLIRNNKANKTPSL